MTFSEMLIIFAAAVFAVVVLLLPWARRTRREKSLQPRAKLGLMFVVCCVLLGVFLLLSIYSVLVGQRSIVWFFVSMLIGLFALYLANSSDAKHVRLSTFAVILLAMAASVIPMLENRGVIINSDQWRDLRVTSHIIGEGTFQDAPGLGTGYYSFVPLFNVLNAGVAQITGWPAMATFTILQVVFSLVASLSIFAIMTKLSGDARFSVLAVLLYLSTPRLANVQVVPSTAGISMGFLFVLLLVKEDVSLFRKMVPIVALLSFTINAFHPVGVFPVLIICVGLSAVNYFSSLERLAPRTVSLIQRTFGICLLVTVTYWTLDSRVFTGVFNPVLRLVHIFTEFGESNPSSYTPQYSTAGLELFSLAWALPVAASAAYAILVLRRKEEKPRLGRDLHQQIIAIAAMAGLLLIATAFVAVLTSPGGGLEKYLNYIGYSLLLLPAAFVFGELLLSKKRIIVLVAVALFSANMVIGLRSPDWAPFENPQFGAFRSTYSSFVEAKTLVAFIPNNTRLYEDYDIPVDEVALLESIQFITDRSYETTRNVLQLFKENSVKPFDDDYSGAVIVIKKGAIVDQRLLSNYVNIVYDSGRHVSIIPLG